MAADQELEPTLRTLLRNHFNGLTLRSPLFYSHRYGLRFDLEVDSSSSEEYFSAGLNRATAIFNKVFSEGDEVLFVVQELKSRPRRRLKGNSLVFQLLKPIEKRYRKISNLYEPGLTHNAFVGALDLKRSDIRTVLHEIQESHFYQRMQRRRPKGKVFNAEVYFINVTRRTIYYMYDSRGVDVVAARIEDLSELFHDLNGWILDYDRKTIEDRFGHDRD